jgi:hypothetical protein
MIAAPASARPTGGKGTADRGRGRPAAQPGAAAFRLATRLPAEREVDAAAARVTGGLAFTGIPASGGPRVHRKCACGGSEGGPCPACEEEERLAVQRMPLEGGLPEEERSSAAGPGPYGIVVDDGAAAGHGQVRRAEFMDRLEARLLEVCGEELAAAGRTVDDCPYLRSWLAYYRERSAVHLERAIRRYAHPEAGDAAGLVEAVVSRARMSVRLWRVTGVVPPFPTGVPEVGIPAAGETVRPMSVGGGTVGPAADPIAVRGRLGEGRPLEGGVRSRMERGFGRSFAGVRIHTDASAARLSRELSARAFTVGSDVAFGAGEFHPGTLIGDALLAHELAHVRQQAPAPPLMDVPGVEGPSALMEADADHQAAAVVARLWHEATAGATPSLPATQRYTGLHLLRCSSSNEERQERDVVAPGISTPDPPRPAPDPRERMKEHLRVVLVDREINPQEWRSVHERSTELGLTDSDLRSILSFEFDVEGTAVDLAALIGTSSNPTIRELARGYTARVPEGTTMLDPDPLPRLIAQIMVDARLDRPELDALRSFSWSYAADAFHLALIGAGISQATAGTLAAFSSFGYSDFQHLIDSPGLFPITFEAGEAGLVASRDLRLVVIESLMRNAEWRQAEFTGVRSILAPLGRVEAAAFLTSAGFEETTAATLAAEFTRTDTSYESMVRSRTGLWIRFERGEGPWRLTPQTRELLSLPWHPTPVGPWTPEGGEVIWGEYTRSVGIGPYTFASGITAEATRLSLTFRGHTMSVITANDLLAEDLNIEPNLPDRVDIALSIIPAAHVRAVRELVLDPGFHPYDRRAGDASREGRLNLYFNRVGPYVQQNDLNYTTVHEFGHLVSFEAERSSPDFWQRWRAAMASDGNAVSRYGTTNELEDFAETYVLYLSGGRTDAAIRARYPARLGIMDTLFQTAGN